MPISGIGAPQWGQGKVSSGAPPASSAAISAGHASSSAPRSTEGGTSRPQWGQGRWPTRAYSTRR